MTQPHMLVIGDRDGRRTFTVECPGVTDACLAWVDCVDDCDHDELDRLAEAGREDPVLHGIRHRDVDGWMVPTGECFIAGYRELAEVAAELWPIGGIPNGRFPVAAVFEPHRDPGDLRLRLLGPADAFTEISEGTS